MRLSNPTTLAELVEALEAEAPQHGGLNQMPLGAVRVYAIAFDLDQETLQAVYPGPSYRNAYGEIRRRMEQEGFQRMQGSLYYGHDKTTPVTCVLVVQRLAQELPWFADAVRDIRMLRIEENNDLKPALPQWSRSLRA